jgi:hypothetical protein
VTLLPVTSTQPRGLYTQPGPLVRPPGPTFVSVVCAGTPVFDASGKPDVATGGTVLAAELGGGDALALTSILGDGLADGLRLCVAG